VSALRDLQRDFAACVLGEGDAVLAHVADTGPVGPDERLRVYADGMRLRFLEVLGENYPGVRALLGDETFEALASAYVQGHPSRSPSIRWFGAGLDRFLGETPPFASNAVLSEMAAFEWAKGILSDAADDPALGVGDIASVAAQEWPSIRPRPVRASRRLDLHWNVPSLWWALERGEPVPRPERNPRPRAWLLWRKGLGIHWRSLEDEEAWAIDACRDGASFGEVCAGLAERLGEGRAPMRAASLLKQWVTDGVIASI
jgi:hypothetical protein